MKCSPPGSSVHGDSPGKNTGVSCHALLQEIFPIQGSNPGLLHCRWILYCLSHQGSPDVIISSVQLLSYVRLFATAWTVACQAPLSRGLSRQEYWNGLPFPSPGIFPIQESNPGLLSCRLILYLWSHQGCPLVWWVLLSNTVSYLVVGWLSTSGFLSILMCMQTFLGILVKIQIVISNKMPLKCSDNIWIDRVTLKSCDS